MATPPAKWLLDTNVLSELRRPRPDQRVTTWIEAQPLDDLYVSTVTLAEIRFGIETLPDQIRRAELETWLAGKVRPMFTHRVLEITEGIMLRCVCLWRKAGKEATPTPSQTSSSQRPRWSTD
jgi:predicted nucleic acid-binding protein